jgi:hypothetical protein
VEKICEQQRKGLVIEEILVHISSLGKQDILMFFQSKTEQLLLFLLVESAIKKKMMASNLGNTCITTFCDHKQDT